MMNPNQNMNNFGNKPPQNFPMRPHPNAHNEFFNPAQQQQYPNNPSTVFFLDKIL